MTQMIVPSRRTANFHYAIRDLVNAAEALERAGRQVISLNIGDPQAYGFRPPAHMVEGVARALRDNFTGYSHSAGLWEAREAVAHYATALGAPTAPAQVLITSGASEAADLILTALVEEGDEVLLPAPGYPLYPAILNKLGAVARYYRLDGGRGWQFAPEELAQLISKRTRALVLINPSNPTGAIVPEKTIREVLELAARHNLLVITDEVYRELSFAERPVAASVIAREVDAPVITLESLSKTHLVPGWRVGWMRFTNEEKMRDLPLAITRLASGRLCSPTPAQYGVRPALEGDKSFLDEFMREIKSRRDFVLAAVKGIKGLSCETPAAAFYAMIRVEDPLRRTDESFVLDLLEETGVLVVHGSGFGTDPAGGFFRLVYLPDESTLGHVFDEIGRFLKSSASWRAAAPGGVSE
ncbi:MAG TPA: aminotransferase class I/II-fold pyridoxal phosphate-dependent enzyme [Pyrinomonadaceae bacterium]|nr:aminotransferase class I/II-fold pyridoxal phosphate-dependent enzyme [Pyrinomonadaceae bacterium]